MADPLTRIADMFEALLEHLYNHSILRPSFHGAGKLHEMLGELRHMAEVQEERAANAVELLFGEDKVREPVLDESAPADATEVEAAHEDTAEAATTAAEPASDAAEHLADPSPAERPVTE